MLGQDEGDHRPRLTALDALERFAVDMEQRQRYGERNRLALLATHGVGLLMVGLLLAVDEPARAVVRFLGQDGTVAFNVLPVLGGSILLVGLLWGRRLILEAIGMGLGLAWDLGMVLVFIVQAADPPPPTPIVPTVSAYPIAIYGTLAVLMGVHLVTLVKITADRRTEGRAARG